MATKKHLQIEEIGGRIEQFAGKNLRKKVMAGSDSVIGSPDIEKVGVWVKAAMDRLDVGVDSSKREQIMQTCGYNCFAINRRPMELARARRRRFATEEEFLAAEVQKPPKGVRLERKGNLLIQFYTPHTFGRGMNCYCYIMRKLPAGVKVSKTYCNCSRGYVEKYWEGILGRPVKVELGETAISGADECRFVICLGR